MMLFLIKIICGHMYAYRNILTFWLSQHPEITQNIYSGYNYVVVLLVIVTFPSFLSTFY